MVTFLFSDIEGSTRILSAIGPEHYAELLGVHRDLIRSAMGDHRGREVDTQGDSFLVTFEHLRDAVAAAIDAQQALARHPWPSGAEIRVRMAIHPTDAALTAHGYVGVGVHRGARICAAGHGGQVLLSQAARDLLLDDPAGYPLIDLGEHRLKDLTSPQRLFQLVIDGLPTGFPPLRTLDARPTNLPTQATALVGRERELADIVGMLRRADVRCLTLTGPGGMGKTRLALAAAAELVEDQPDGVFFVPLAAITDEALVLAQVAQALGVNEGAGQELHAYLATKSLLLVVDNLEQVIAAASDVGSLIAAAPNLRLLVTSREPLHLAAERVYPIQPLGLPDKSFSGHAADLVRADAVALFVERARAVEPSFEVTDGNARTIAAICVRLDGLPLALELAASRVGFLSLDAILDRLEAPFKLLKGGHRDAPERHQALERTLAWSYELLDEDERRLFDRLAVFLGGFSLEAVEAVCDAELETLASLVDKSLVRRDGERYAMLETIRSYAQDRLALSGEEGPTGDRHASFFETLAAAAYAGSISEQTARADDLEQDHGNLRAALDRLGVIDPDRRLGMAGRMGWFWHAHSHLTEGRSRLADALAGRSEHDEDRARALCAAGALAGYQGDLPAGRAMFDEGIDIWRTLRRERDLAQALFDLGWGCFFVGDDTTARRCMAECLEISQRLADPALINRGQLGLLQILVSIGDLETVRTLGAEALQLSRAIGDHWAEHFAHHFLADCALIDGDYPTAAAHYARSLEAAARAGDRIETCFELQGVAMASAGLGKPERALRIAGAADAQLRSLGQNFSVPFWEALLERHLGAARTALGAEADAAWLAGQRLTLEAAVAEASQP
jgi:predicted ATPase/class 3 adenylate cyclase